MVTIYTEDYKLEDLGKLYELYRENPDDVSVEDFLKFYDNIIDLREDYDSLQYELNELKQAKEFSSSENEELSNQIDEINLNNQKLLEKYQRIAKTSQINESKNNELLKENNELKQEIESLKLKSMDLEEEIHNLTQEKQNLMNLSYKTSMILDSLDDNVKQSNIDVDIKTGPYYKILDESLLFDKEWYIQQYLPDKKETDAVKHYLNIGYLLNYNPNRSFDSIDYIQKHPEIQKSNIPPIIDYILEKKGNKKEINTEKDNHNIKDSLEYNLIKNSELFDEEFYVNCNPLIESYEDPIEHFLINGCEEKYPTSKYFDVEFYLEHNGDVKRAGLNPLVHFITNGKKENRIHRRARLSSLDIAKITGNPKIKEMYDAIYKSKYFDEEYYLNNNQIKNAQDIDPILHYILIGADKGFNPSIHFSTSKYLDLYVDVKDAGINPLFHYITVGHKENRKIFSAREDVLDFFGTLKSPVRCKDIYQQLHEKVSVIIPIYNAYEETCNCIQSVLLNTNVDYELVLIDDCSTDKRISQLLDMLENIPFIKIIRNQENQGFVKNVNLGLTTTENDVVLLNSDTIVTPRWLTHLTFSAYSKDDIATVTPFCNASDISIPELGELEDQIFLNKNAYQLNKLSNYRYLTSPTGNGFCLFIKREVIDEIGLFDEDFGRGYGEESDFTQRAVKAGYRNIRNDSVFVYHKRHASFSEETSNQLKIDNRKLLEQKHENIFRDWDVFANSVEVKHTLENIRKTLKAYKDSERILYVTTRCDNKTLIDEKFKQLSGKYDTFVLELTAEQIQVLSYDNDIFSTLKFWKIDDTWTIDDYFTYYFNVLNHLKIDLVYVKNTQEYLENDMLSIFTTMTDYLEIEYINEDEAEDVNLVEHVEELLNPIRKLDDLIEENNVLIDFKDKNNVIYTFTNENHIQTSSFIDDDFKYICFSENPKLKSNQWEIKYLENVDIEDIKFNPKKYIPEYENLIWIDSKYDITGDLKHFINKYIKDKKLLTIRKDDNINTDIIFSTNDENSIKSLQNLPENHEQIGDSYALADIYPRKNEYFQKHLKEEIKLIFSQESTNNVMDSFREKTTIIIPVYNAYEETKNCIDSVLENTKIPYKLLLINDASTDSKIRELLESYKSRNVKVIHNNTNQGFVKSINIGLEESNADVVLLNSDTIVTPKWLEKLKTRAYSQKNIATVTPVSNNSGAFSVPELDEDNPINPELGLNSTANIIEKIDDTSTIDTPTANGFCMYIKRKAIDEAGLFDEVFGRGYGEENDFCMKLVNNGWKHVIDLSTYIYHKGSVSFNEEKDELIEKNRQLLDQRYPDYSNNVSLMVESIHYAQKREKIGRTLNSKQAKSFDTKRILYLTNDEKIENLIKTINSLEGEEQYILSTNEKELKLYEYTNNLNLLNTWVLTETDKIRLLKEYKTYYLNLLYILKIDEVNVENPNGHAFDLHEVAKRIGIPTYVSSTGKYISSEFIKSNERALESLLYKWRENVRIKLKK